MTSPRLMLYRLKKRIQEKVSPAPPPKAAPAPARKPAPVKQTTHGDMLTLDLAAISSEAAFQQISQRAVSLEDLGDSTLDQAAKHYGKFGMHEKILGCRHIQMVRSPKNATIHNYARALFAAGDAQKALEYLDQIDRPLLTERGEKMVNQDQFSCLRACGRTDEAYELLLNVEQDKAVPDMSNVLKLAEIERQKGLLEDAYDRLLRHITDFGKQPAYLEQLSACLGEMNRNSQALMIAGLLCSDPRPTTPHIVRYFNLLWQEGDVDQLCLLIERIARLRMMHPSLLATIKERAHAEPRIAQYLAQFEENVRSSAKGALDDKLITVAERFYALELFDDARAMADQYIRFFDQNPAAYFVRGASNFHLGDNDRAEQDLMRCVALNPSYFKAYSILLFILPRKQNGVRELAALLEIRNAAHWKYTAYGSDGRRGLLDIEGSQVSFMQGDFMRGQKLRQERSICRYLEQHYPSKYNSYANPEFPSMPEKSLLVITEDGVGDELRWSQYFSELREHYKSVEATCDPRFYSLMARSFPNVTFYPFKRRLMEKVEKNVSNPSSEVPFFPLARLVDNALYARLDSFDELRLSADMVRGAWAKKPNGQPSMEGPDPKPFLVPQTERVAHWHKKLDTGRENSLKVGILWRSNFVTPMRRKHYLDLENLRQLLRTPGVKFYSLQANHTEHEIDQCYRYGIEILEEIDLQDDFEEAAAVTSAMDLVIGANSFIAEMAAAVGTPVWLLGAYNNLVRFRLGDSPDEVDRMTPNMRILRVDREKGFIGSDSDLQKQVAALAGSRLRSFVKTNTQPMQGTK